MSQIEGTTRCDGCGVEILLSPVLVDQHHYCCMDCASGLFCDCAKQAESEEPEPGKTVYYSDIEMYV